MCYSLLRFGVQNQIWKLHHEPTPENTTDVLSHPSPGPRMFTSGISPVNILAPQLRPEANSRSTPVLLDLSTHSTTGGFTFNSGPVLTFIPQPRTAGYVTHRHTAPHCATPTFHNFRGQSQSRVLKPSINAGNLGIRLRCPSSIQVKSPALPATWILPPRAVPPGSQPTIMPISRQKLFGGFDLSQPIRGPEPRGIQWGPKLNKLTEFNTNLRAALHKYDAGAAAE